MTNVGPVNYKSDSVRAWAKDALKDGRVDRQEAKQLESAVNANGGIDIDETSDIVTISSSFKLDPGVPEDLVRIMFIGNSQCIPGFLGPGNASSLQAQDVKVRKADSREAKFYEVDTSAGGQFKNPDFAVDKNGNIVMNYIMLYNGILEADGKPEKQEGLYKWALGVCGLVEEPDANGTYHFYFQGVAPENRNAVNETDTFKAFSMIAAAEFVYQQYPSMRGETDPNGRAGKLVRLFASNNLIPQGVETDPKTGELIIVVYKIGSGSLARIPTGEYNTDNNKIMTTISPQVMERAVSDWVSQKNSE